jgi:hypothetical protein
MTRVCFECHTCQYFVPIGACADCPCLVVSFFAQHSKVPMYIQLTPGFQCPELGETDSFMVVVLRSPQGGTICGDEVREQT